MGKIGSYRDEERCNFGRLAFRGGLRKIGEGSAEAHALTGRNGVRSPNEAVGHCPEVSFRSPEARPRVGSSKTGCGIAVAAPRTDARRDCGAMENRFACLELGRPAAEATRGLLDRAPSHAVAPSSSSEAIDGDGSAPQE